MDVLPFGWKYPPLVSQRLVSAPVPKGLKGSKALGITYSDNVLLSTLGCFHVRCAVKRACKVMHCARFLFTEKSMLHPVHKTEFIGKVVSVRS